VIRHPRIACTGIDLSSLLEPGFEKAVSRLGGELVDDVGSATHLLTDRVRRTEKALIAFSQTPYLLTAQWLKDSIAQGHFVQPDKYFLQDPEAEAKWGFKLSERQWQHTHRIRNTAASATRISSFFFHFSCVCCSQVPRPRRFCPE
jgi:hypothetical protein